MSRGRPSQGPMVDRVRGMGLRAFSHSFCSARLPFCTRPCACTKEEVTAALFTTLKSLSKFRLSERGTGYSHGWEQGPLPEFNTLSFIEIPRSPYRAIWITDVLQMVSLLALFH